jgi:hypothetical protein
MEKFLFNLPFRADSEGFSVNWSEPIGSSQISHEKGQSMQFFQFFMNSQAFEKFNVLPIDLNKIRIHAGVASAVVEASFRASAWSIGEMDNPRRAEAALRGIEHQRHRTKESSQRR